jgi:hypothetical protein
MRFSMGGQDSADPASGVVGGMIERFAFVKLAPEHATDETRRALAAQAREILRPLPGVLSITIGLPADEDSAKAWDLCVNVRFANLADAANYRFHPVHRQFVTRSSRRGARRERGGRFSVETV